MATIVDVAQRAGVSTATVSRVFNGATVSDERTAAVRQAAADLGFIPNRAARSLRRQRSELIALIIPDIENPYFTEIARGAEDVAREAGYSLVLCNSDADPAKEAEYLRIAAAEKMAGVLLAISGDGSELPAPAERPTSIVAIDRVVAGAPLDEVVMDNREAGALATGAVRARRRIVCITGPEHVATARDRADGCRDAGAHDVVFATFGVEGGRLAMEALLDGDDPPSAVIAGNNLLGVGVLQALSSRGLTQRDVEIAVIGSLPFTTLDPHSVTIVRLPARTMGEVAARVLIRRVDGDASAPQRVVLGGELRAAD